MRCYVSKYSSLFPSCLANVTILHVRPRASVTRGALAPTASAPAPAPAPALTPAAATFPPPSHHPGQLGAEVMPDAFAGPRSGCRRLG